MWKIYKMFPGKEILFCFQCGSFDLEYRRAKLICKDCHSIVETCCE